MTRLNQILAVEKGIKARSVSELIELYKVVQKPDLFAGFVKSYEKRDEDDADLPTEKKRVQFRADEVLRAAERTATTLYEIIARKDWTNCVARADIIVDGRTLATSVPVTYLLFLEKQLTDLHTFAAAIPVLDEADAWSKDVNSGLYVTEPTRTHRTKKIAKPIVLYPATPEHPAQTQMVAEDVIAGYWSQVRQSGAMPKPEHDALVERVGAVLRAVKEARESANVVKEVVPPDVAGEIFNFVLG